MTPVSPPVTILMPTYNDWQNVVTLLPDIDTVLAGEGLNARVYVVDDASTDLSGKGEIPTLTLSNIDEVRVIELTRNVGNQRAIAIGLGYIADTDSDEDGVAERDVVIMDSDHEDKPEYIPRLVVASAAEGGAIVFAERTERSEGILFRMLYQMYKLAFLALTGRSLSFGNFSLIPAALVRRVATIAELWDSYPSAIIRAKFRIGKIESARGHRATGRSQMNLAALGVIA